MGHLVAELALDAETLAGEYARQPALTCRSEVLLLRGRPIASATSLDYPAGKLGVLHTVLPKGMTPDGLYQDRILNEGFETAYPSS